MVFICRRTSLTNTPSTPVLQVIEFKNPTVLPVPPSLHDHPPPDLALSHHVGSHNSTSSNVTHQKAPLPVVPNHITIDNARIQQDLAIQQSLLGLNNPGTYRGAVSPRVIPRANLSTKIRWNGQRETFAVFQAAFEGQLALHDTMWICNHARVCHRICPRTGGMPCCPSRTTALLSTT